MENLCHADMKYKKSGKTIIIADEVDISRDEEGNFIMLKGSIIQEDNDKCECTINRVSK